MCATSWCTQKGRREEMAYPFFHLLLNPHRPRMSTISIYFAHLIAMMQVRSSAVDLFKNPVRHYLFYFVTARKAISAVHQICMNIKNLEKRDILSNLYLANQCACARAGMNCFHPLKGVEQASLRMFFYWTFLHFRPLIISLSRNTLFNQYVNPFIPLLLKLEFC